jgi:hypothetical protein
MTYVAKRAVDRFAFNNAGYQIGWFCLHSQDLQRYFLTAQITPDLIIGFPPTSSEAKCEGRN